MNESFVNIKVDREERPDLDEIYMTATQLITRAGGWPNSVFLTPELEPFSPAPISRPRTAASNSVFRRFWRASRGSGGATGHASKSPRAASPRRWNR